MCCLHIAAAGLKIIIHVGEGKNPRRRETTFKSFCSATVVFFTLASAACFNIKVFGFFLVFGFLDEYVLDSSGYQMSQLFPLDSFLKDR